jgi:hypothetical protein
VLLQVSCDNSIWREILLGERIGLAHGLLNVEVAVHVNRYVGKYSLSLSFTTTNSCGLARSETGDTKRRWPVLFCRESVEFQVLSSCYDQIRMWLLP